MLRYKRRCALNVVEFNMLFTGNVVNKDVDIYNARSGVWTTAILSVGRSDLAATSLPNDGLAIFGGGFPGALYDHSV